MPLRTPALGYAQVMEKGRLGDFPAKLASRIEYRRVGYVLPTKVGTGSEDGKPDPPDLAKQRGLKARLIHANDRRGIDLRGALATDLRLRA